MEVLSIFTSDKKTIKLFDDFIYSYPKLKFSTKDLDTAYFHNFTENRSEIYYHFKLCDIIHQLSINYSSNDIGFIVEYFKDKEIFLFDISFRNKVFIKSLLDDFKIFLLNKNITDCKIIISDPFTGLKIL